jgi:steroid delta-isomerase-like uncharacterized protein
MTPMKKANQALIQARYEAVNAHEYDSFQSFYAPDVAWRDPATPRPVKGPRSVRKRLEAWTTAVPNLRWHLDDLFGENDRLCAQFTFTGSHKGLLLVSRGKVLLPTGRSFRLQGVGVYVVAEGQIVDSRIWFDLAPFTFA